MCSAVLTNSGRVDAAQALRLLAGVDDQVRLLLLLVFIFVPAKSASCRPAPGRIPFCSFYPRTPAGCDTFHGDLSAAVEVSTHAPARGATRACASVRRGLNCFYPRVPCGTRQFAAKICDIPPFVSIHASRVGRDGEKSTLQSASDCFYPRVPCGTRLERLRCAVGDAGFYPRVPCGTRLSDVVLGTHSFLYVVVGWFRPPFFTPKPYVFRRENCANLLRN